jgi:hypothetical protein
MPPGEVAQQFPRRARVFDGNRARGIQAVHGLLKAGGNHRIVLVADDDVIAKPNPNETAGGLRPRD